MTDGITGKPIYATILALYTLRILLHNAQHSCYLDSIYLLHVFIIIILASVKSSLNGNIIANKTSSSGNWIGLNLLTYIISLLVLASALAH